MLNFVQEYYLWVKALHLIAAISWMVGMLYLPRLFVYHVSAPIGSQESETFKVMERRLLKVIINPAMIATWIFGGLLLWANPSLFSQGWIHVKLTVLLLLSALHGVLSRNRKQFMRDENKHSAFYYRVLNEVCTVFMIIIVIMAVVRPF